MYCAGGPITIHNETMVNQGPFGVVFLRADLASIEVGSVILDTQGTFGETVAVFAVSIHIRMVIVTANFDAQTHIMEIVVRVIGNYDTVMGYECFYVVSQLKFTLGLDVQRCDVVIVLIIILREKCLTLCLLKFFLQF